MSAATMSQATPVIPARPSRSQEKDTTDTASNSPVIPPRPTKRFNRSVSPNPDRFAPSPLNETTFHKNSNAQRLSPGTLSPGIVGPTSDPISRAKSVDLPSIGQEGQEYAVISGEAASSSQKENDKESQDPVNLNSSNSPEHTRTIGADIKLHAPRPTVPAQNAKERVAAVTRTDSDRAASFGIGRPSSIEPSGPPRSLKKKASTTSQLSQGSQIQDDESGIPEIGQRVPMYPNAGDVQAPSPAPPAVAEGNGAVTGRSSSRHHTRRASSRSGFESVPPGSYGLHGHGVESTDKLEKAYYEKHPELKKHEQCNQLHDRVNDYAMTSEELNKIVQETASRGGGGFGTSDYEGAPSEQVGFQATEEYTSRISSPRPASAAKPPLKGTSVSGSNVPTSNIPATGTAEKGSNAKNGANSGTVIHVDEPGNHKGYAKFGDESSAIGAGAEENYEAPILASDEVAKDPNYHEQQPAIAPPTERRGSSHEMDQPRSRPNSRPPSIYSPPPNELHSTPLENVAEYEPLFPEDEDEKGLGKHKSLTAQQLNEIRQRFPSRDIWEDAPNSVHATALVTTPEPSEARNFDNIATVTDQSLPSRDTETPAQAFARKQEELAEKEDRTADSFLYRTQGRPESFVEPQTQTANKENQNNTNRFPSRDVWEDTPDSLQLQTTVTGPQQDQEPSSPNAEKERPTIPARPPKKQTSGDEKPPVSDRPKPQIPLHRPSKSPGPDTKAAEAAVSKQKPAVPARPAGGKIAALQAGFMSDLNKRLQIGPKAPKKDEPKADEELEEKEKKPLSDARKGRARGPQRRAPTRKTNATGSTPPPASTNGKPVLSFSAPRTLWCIDEEGTMTVDGFGKNKSTSDAKPVDIVTVEEKDLGVKEDTDGTEKEAKASLNEETPNIEETTKTLAANAAGEPVLEASIEKKSEDNQVDVVKEVGEEAVS